MFKLSKEQLLFDIYVAHELAIKGKKKKKYIKQYSKNLEAILLSLRDRLWSKSWEPGLSSCFIIVHPKKREVFAAEFEDRIVHHLYFNYTHELFERTFITDSYSCIKGRGTHYGIHRLKHHILSESNNWENNVYILKLDIKGYFMNINRNILLEEAMKTLNRMKCKHISKESEKTWCDVIDFDLVQYLTEKIALLDVTKSYVLICDKSMYDGLPHSKSLFYSPEGCGLPIGNLTSQLFSNVYLNLLDQYCKKVLKCKHYGRYVDDFFIVSKDKEFLLSIIPKIEGFLMEKLGLEIQHGKIIITTSNHGVEFLGAFVKPHRTYISNQCIRRTKTSISNIKPGHEYNSINSLLGVYGHFHSYNIRKEIFGNLEIPEDYFYNDEMTKLIKQ